jgi:hypothetical protein
MNVLRNYEVLFIVRMVFAAQLLICHNLEGTLFISFNTGQLTVLNGVVFSKVP